MMLNNVNGSLRNNWLWFSVCTDNQETEYRFHIASGRATILFCCNHALNCKYNSAVIWNKS